ncbi:MAG TPA: type II toxin-antitoxin system RelE/ParE family toxin [Nitrospira sp.]|jgi:phage-related protein|nr:type II toxin-antitoxin system RelE/ParE family toxin [Nitrospira sp.]
MASSSSRLVYDGAVLRIEFYVAPNGVAPAEAWLEQLSRGSQQKFAALFARMGDTGKIWNERKFKHLTETDQIFEFKVDADRILCFFFIGRRLILTHGFRKSGDKTPTREIERAESYKHDFEGRVRHET